MNKMNQRIHLKGVGSDNWIEGYESRLKEYYQYCEENGREAICLCKQCKGKETHPMRSKEFEEEENHRLRKERIPEIEDKETNRKERMDDVPLFFQLDLDSIRNVFSYLDMKNILSISMVCSKFWNIHKQYLVKNVCFSNIGCSEQSIKRLNNNLIKRYVCDYGITNLTITINETNINTLVTVFERGNQIERLDVQFEIGYEHLDKVEQIIRSLVRVSSLKIHIFCDGDPPYKYNVQDYTLWGINNLASTLRELTLMYFNVDEVSMPFSELTKLEFLDTNITISDDISGIPPNLKTLSLEKYFYPEVVEFRYLENLTLQSNNPDNLPNAPLLTTLNAQSDGIDLPVLFTKYPKLKGLSLGSIDFNQFNSLISERSTTQLESFTIYVDDSEDKLKLFEETPNIFTDNFANLTQLTFEHNSLSDFTKVYEDIAELKYLRSFGSNNGCLIVEEKSQSLQIFNTTFGRSELAEELSPDESFNESSED